MGRPQDAGRLPPLESSLSPPTVSVVIATYNRWPLVREAITSALEQTYPPLEVVVIDDGSPDGTAEHLKGFHPDVRVIWQHNTERGAAFNNGIRAARGEWVALLGDDDIHEPWHLEQFVAALAQHSDAEVFGAPGWWWYPDEDRRRLIGRFDEETLVADTLRGTTVLPQGLIARRDTLLEVGGFPEDRALAGAEDWILMMKLARHCRVRALRRPSVRVRLHAGRSMTDGRFIISARERATDVVLREGILGHQLDPVSRQVLQASTDLFAGGTLYVEGDMIAARRRLRAVRERVGWRRSLQWGGGRLWLQTLMGPAVSKVVRRVKQRLTWRT